jgi:hypothetical protein
MAPKTAQKKGSPIRTKPSTSAGVTTKAPAATLAAEDKKSKKSDVKRKTRHQYDRVIHQVFTPFFSGLEQHLVSILCDKEKVVPDDVHAAIVGYDAKTFFQKQYEGKRRVGKKSRTGSKRQLSTFMLFQNDMREKVSTKLEKELGRTATQPEVVTHLGQLWNSMKLQPGGIEHYKQLYEENKRKAALESVSSQLE